VAHFVLPSLVIGPGERLSGGLAVVSDGGDQDDHLVLAVSVPVRDVVLDHPDRPG
jgi:hypothetical protein